MGLVLNIILILGLSVVLPWSLPGPQVDQQALLYLQNVPLQDEQLLIVNVTVAEVTNLFGAEFQLRYNPAQLRLRDNDPRLDGIQIKPGPLIDFEDRFVVQNSANPETGLINFAFTLLRSADPISGGGVLATVVFEIQGGGPIAVEVANVQLVASDFMVIPVSTKDLIIETAAAETRTGTTPPLWPQGRTMLLISVLTGLILLILIGFGWLQRRPFRQTDSALVRRTPTSVSTSGHSAALLAQQGHRAVEQDDPARAYELFSQAIELDPANVEAWLGKGLLAQQPIEKRICLQRVLALDPENQVAKNALEQLP